MSLPADPFKTTEEKLSFYRQSGDMQLREAIAYENAHLAEILAKRYSGRGIDYDDLYQVASIGLLYAIDRFNPDFNVKFNTFAVHTIRGEIKKHFRDTGNFIRIPRKMYETYARAERLHEHKPYSIISLNQTQDDENLQLPENVIGQTDDSFLLVEDKDFIYRCMQTLTGEEHTFLVARYYDAMTQQQIAEKMHVSQMYVSRLEKKVLKKLRDLYMKD